MFEKEAEEYAEESLKGFREYIYLDQAERKIEEAVLFGFDKANEWHFVKEEGLPINRNDGANYLLYTIYGKGGSPVVAYFVYKDKQELMNIWTGAILTEDKVIAWKEIVLPEQKENK